ncbi:MAG: phage-shock protein [Deltaproteobacteria bacterium]|nr:phage-shock protein [Deltaproteobacteria bacterium]
MSEVLLAFVLILGLPVLIVAGFFLIWVLKILTRGGPHKRDEAQAEETRLIQELHQGLLKMEERIEALETILLDAEKKEDRK